MSSLDNKQPMASYDAGDGHVSVWGVSGRQVRAADLTGSGVAVTDAPVSGQYLVITDINLSATAATIVHLCTDAGGSPFWTEDLPASGGAQRTWRGKFKLPTADKKVIAQSPAAVTTSILLGYHSEG